MVQESEAKYEIYKQIIDAKDLTNYNVAIGAGVSQSVFSAWKNGGSKPNKTNLKKIADFLGVTTAELRGQKEKPVTGKDDELEKKIESIINSKIGFMQPTLSEQERENIRIFQELPEEKKQEALRYMRYLAETKDT